MRTTSDLPNDLLSKAMKLAHTKTKTKTIAIALAVYNGGGFLAQQLESTARQEHQDWHLYVRDDGSHDDSQAMIENFSKKDERVHLLTDKKGNLGASANFSLLLNQVTASSANYVALSDQDDIWVANKLSGQLAVMRSMEQHHPDTPIMIHTDAEVVDASLHPVGASLMHYQGIKHETSHPLRVLLAQNFVTGCTVLINRPLLEIALPIPEEALMHDWWLALCAAVFGQIEYIDKPLVKYRQHGNNEVGVKHLTDFLNPFTGRWWKRWLAGRDNLFQSMRQAEVLAERIRKHDPHNPNLGSVETYASLADIPPLQRIRRLHNLRVHAQSKIRQALLLSRLLLTPQDQNV